MKPLISLAAVVLAAAACAPQEGRMAQAPAAGPTVATDTAIYAPETIQAVQEALKERRFVVGNVEGRMDEETRFGLRDFQQRQRLPATGSIDPQTLQALGIRPQ